MRHQHEYEEEEEEEKRVRFANEEMHIHYEFDNGLVGELWYDKTDYASFRFENHIVIRAVKEGASLDENEYCTRGLEKRINEDWPLKNRQKTIQIVLSEQAMQKKLGYHDEHAMRHVSRMCTRWERQQALTLAALDAVEEEHAPMPTPSRRRIVAVFDGEESPTRYTPAMYSSPSNNNNENWPSPREIWQKDTWWKESETVSTATTRPTALKRNLANLVASRQARPPRNGGLACLFCQAVPV